MSSIQLLTGPVVDALGWALLHLVWQGAVVAGLLAAALALLSRRSSNVRYAAACAALALLPILATITAVRAYHPTAKPQATATIPDTLEPVIAVIIPAQPPAAVEAAAAPPIVTRVLTAARTNLPVIVLVWLTGVAVLATRLLICWARVQRMARDHAKNAAAVWSSSVRRLSRALGLHRAVRLLESAAVEVPTVIGWLRPVILLPASTLAGLSPEQIEMLLAHELAHIRRNDFFINLLQALVETLMFYHPAVWWISERVRVERENCCDDLAVAVCGNAVQYARALTRLEELRAGVQYAAVAANGASLLDRIRRLIGSPRETTGTAPRWAAGAAVLSIVIALIALPSLPLFAEHEEAKKPAKKEARAQQSSAEVNVDADAVEADRNSDSDADGDVDTEGDVDVPDVPVVAPAAPPAPPARPAPGAHPAPPAPAVPANAVRMHPMVAVAPHIAQAVADGVEGALEGIDDIDIDVDIDFDDPETKNFGKSGKLTVDELITLRNSGVTPEYIQQMRAASLGELTLGQMVVMRRQGVTPDYVRDLRAAGVDVRNARDVIALRMHGVSPEYVQQMAGAGYRNLMPKELIQLRSHGVNPAFIKALADAGYTNLSVKDISRLAASGVNADFIREIAQYKDKK